MKKSNIGSIVEIHLQKPLMLKYTIQKSPFLVPTTDGKLIEKHFGRAGTSNSQISIAHMVAPPHWSKPFQTPVI